MKKKDIEIFDVRAARPEYVDISAGAGGMVDIGELEDFPPTRFRVLRAPVGMAADADRTPLQPGVRGGFLMRLKEGTWPGHILEHVTLELQNLAGMPGGFGKARDPDPRRVQGHRPRLARGSDAQPCSRPATWSWPPSRTVLSTCPPVDNLRRLVDEHCLGPSTACIVDAADDRDIPSSACRTATSSSSAMAPASAASGRPTDQTSAIAEASRATRT
jgi:cyanophycin synthetase